MLKTLSLSRVIVSAQLDRFVIWLNIEYRQRTGTSCIALARTKITKIIFAGIGLAVCNGGSVAAVSNNAQFPSTALKEFVGTWLIVPRRAPDVAPAGEIPRAVILTERGGSIQGTFHWLGRVFAMSNCEIRNRVLVSKVTVLDRTLILSGQLLSDGEQMDVWIGDHAQHAGVAPFFTRRISAKKFAAALRAAPKIDPRGWIAQPLPSLENVPSNGLALTPPMGWNSWNLFREAIDDRTVRQMADALVDSGLRDVGYVYINIDDSWQGQRDGNGILHPNKKFPNMKALAKYVHTRGLKLGMYSSPGPLTCANYLGSEGHERQDAGLFARWGVDLLKYDWCSAELIHKNQAEMQAAFQLMGNALQATGRPIVYSLSQYGKYEVGRWARKVGANLWRTNEDLGEGDLWTAIDRCFDHNGSPEESGPSGWNDEDMALVGITGLTFEEYRTHFTLWSVLASPIILGNDLRIMSVEVKAILTNPEVIGINQDKLGYQGKRRIKKNAAEIWTKPLADGSTAVALFNRGESPTTVNLRWSDIGLTRQQHVRNLWEHSYEGVIQDGYSAALGRHSSVLLKLTDTH